MVLSILNAALECWLAFGFGFVAESVQKAIQLEARNIERLLPYIETLPKWLQDMIKKVLEEILDNIRQKYIGEKFVTFINVAWFFAMVSKSCIELLMIIFGGVFLLTSA